jgi:DNA polymerase III sliding clamp (beta) subunit (PCNA family)
MQTSLTFTTSLNNMQFTISKSELQNALAIVGRCVNVNNVLAAWGMVKLEVEGTQLTVSSFDGGRGLVYTTTCESKDIFTAFVKHSDLKVINDLPEQPLIIRALKTQLEFEHNTGKFKVAFESEGFDVLLVQGEPLTVAAESLVSALNKTSFACATDKEPRTYLQGVLAEFGEDKLQLTATDANVFSTTHVSATASPGKVTIPKKTVDVFTGLPMDAECVIIVTADKIQFKPNEQTTLVSTLIAEKYLDYTVLFKEMPITVTVDRLSLLNAVKRSANFAYSFVKLEFVGDILVVSSEDVDMAKEYREEIKATKSGSDLYIGFVANVLISALARLASEVVALNLADTNRAMFLKESADCGFENCMLVMPVKL